MSASDHASSERAPLGSTPAAESSSAAYRLDVMTPWTAMVSVCHGSRSSTPVHVLSPNRVTWTRWSTASWNTTSDGVESPRGVRTTTGMPAGVRRGSSALAAARIFAASAVRIPSRSRRPARVSPACRVSSRTVMPESLALGSGRAAEAAVSGRTGVATSVATGCTPRPHPAPRSPPSSTRAATGASIHLPPDERRNLHVTEILRRLVRRRARLRRPALGRRRRARRHHGLLALALRRERQHRRRRHHRGARRRFHDGARLQRAIEAGRDDGDAKLALHRRLVHGAENDFGVVAHRVVHDLVDLVDFA